METRERITFKIKALDLKTQLTAKAYIENNIKSSDSTPQEMGNNLIGEFKDNNYQTRCDMSNDEDLATLEALVNKDLQDLESILATLKNY